MGSDFNERNKRKSALAFLLLLLGGNAKYAAVLLIAVLGSLPFLISGDKLNVAHNFPVVAKMLRAAGLGGPAAPDMLSAAALSKDGSGAGPAFWQRYLRAANSPPPPAGSPSTMAMLRIGPNAYGPAVIKDTGKPAGPGKVKGVVNAQERASGYDGAGVDLEGAAGEYAGDPAGESGGKSRGKSAGKSRGESGGQPGYTLAGEPGSEPGGYGELLGANLGSRQLGYAGPYANRQLLRAAGGAADTKEGAYNQVMVKAGERVPVPGAPRKTRAKMGRVSAFTFKSMPRKNQKSQYLGYLKAIDNKIAVIHMKQATVMATMAALDIETTTPEYAADYSGAVYDGNSVDLDLMTLEGDAVAPSVPNVAFATQIADEIDKKLKEGKVCADLYKKLSKQTEKMQTEFDTLRTVNGGKQPTCCNSGSTRNRWNRSVDGVRALCEPANDTIDELNAQGCDMQKQEKFNCANYNGMHAPDCPLGFIQCILSWLITIVAAVLLIVSFFNPFGLALLGALAVIGGAAVLAALLIYLGLSLK